MFILNDKLYNQIEVRLEQGLQIRDYYVRNYEVFNEKYMYIECRFVFKNNDIANYRIIYNYLTNVLMNIWKIDEMSWDIGRVHLLYNNTYFIEDDDINMRFTWKQIGSNNVLGTYLRKNMFSQEIIHNNNLFAAKPYFGSGDKRICDNCSVFYKTNPKKCSCWNWCIIDSNTNKLYFTLYSKQIHKNNYYTYDMTDTYIYGISIDNDGKCYLLLHNFLTHVTKEYNIKKYLPANYKKYIGCLVQDNIVYFFRKNSKIDALLIPTFEYLFTMKLKPNIDYANINVFENILSIVAKNSIYYYKINKIDKI